MGSLSRQRKQKSLNAPAIFQFDSFPSYFDSCLQYLQARYPKAFSFNWFSRQLGYQSHQTTAFIARGARLPSQEFLQRFANWWQLTTTEKRYLELLAQGLRKRSASQLAQLKMEMRQLVPKKSPARRVLTKAELSQIAHWWNLPIKQLVSTPDFRNDAKWLAKRLSDRITPAQAERSLERLAALGLLTRVTDARGFTPAPPNIASALDLPDEAVRLYHKEQLEQGRQRLERLPTEEREFSALTFRCPRKNLPQAKLFLRSMIDEFDARFSQADTRDVFQLNIQFFPQTNLDDSHE